MIGSVELRPLNEITINPRTGNVVLSEERMQAIFESGREKGTMVLTAEDGRNRRQKIEELK